MQRKPVIVFMHLPEPHLLACPDRIETTRYQDGSYGCAVYVGGWRISHAPIVNKVRARAEGKARRIWAEHATRATEVL